MNGPLASHALAEISFHSPAAACLDSLISPSSVYLSSSLLFNLLQRFQSTQPSPHSVGNFFLRLSRDSNWYQSGRASSLFLIALWESSTLWVEEKRKKKLICRVKRRRRATKSRHFVAISKIHNILILAFFVSKKKSFGGLEIQKMFNIFEMWKNVSEIENSTQCFNQSRTSRKRNAKKCLINWIVFVCEYW